MNRYSPIYNDSTYELRALIYYLTTEEGDRQGAVKQNIEVNSIMMARIGIHNNYSSAKNGANWANMWIAIYKHSAHNFTLENSTWKKNLKYAKKQKQLDEGQLRSQTYLLSFQV